MAQLRPVASNEQAQPTLGDLALEELAGQLARTSKDLAVLRAQYRQLVAFVESKSDVLGLSRSDDGVVQNGSEDPPNTNA